MVKELYPQGPAERFKDMQRHRGEYIVPGPNYLWSLDGYCKLDAYGMEIYAAIDAYSRYIVWIYVGVTARTSVSVLGQYLNTLEDIKVCPRYLRSDRGVETPLCANAHHAVRRHALYKGDQQPELAFKDCYLYGTSTANQRIESWWGQLSKGTLYCWRVRSKTYFVRHFADIIRIIYNSWPLMAITIIAILQTALHSKLSSCQYSGRKYTASYDFGMFTKFENNQLV